MFAGKVLLKLKRSNHCADLPQLDGGAQVTLTEELVATGAVYRSRTVPAAQPSRAPGQWR